MSKRKAAASGGSEEAYLELLLKPLDESSEHKPKFGSADKAGVSLDQFKRMYGSDPFYHWVGLDDDLMYAAHKAAGGMTSIYRQLGQGCERLFKAVVRDSLGLSNEQVSWSYETEKRDGGTQVNELDARIDLEHVRDRPDQHDKVKEWLARCAGFLNYSKETTEDLRGAIFEVRQGYKSADAKRQNADLRFATNAAHENYLPVLAVVSTQTSRTVIRRYKNAKMLVITGHPSDDDTSSTYAFFRNAVGYELDKFFERNQEKMRERFRVVIEKLLSPS